MTRYLVLAAALLACTAKSDRTDSADAALPAIDTLKPVAATDTLVTAPETTAAAPRGASGATGSKATGSKTTGSKASTKIGRDSAFPPPRHLPKLDTVPRKRPPR